MSNTIRYDPLLVRYLSDELHQRLRDRACAASPVFASERVAVLPLDRGEALQLDLHPRRGWIRIVPWETEPEDLDAFCDGCSAPVDERILQLRIRSPDRFRAQQRTLVIELHHNQWNALLVSEDDGRIQSVLWSRTAGARALRAGAAYQPPAGGPRIGVLGETREQALELWTRVVGEAPPDQRQRALVRTFAFTGTINARSILGDAARDVDPARVEGAFQRWWELRSLPPVQPGVLQPGSAPQPYPVPLPGLEWQATGSLLDAMAASAEPGRPIAEDAAAEVLPLLRRRAHAATRRVERLESQLSRGGEAETMRLWGDLLLARKRLVPRGVRSVRLQNWEGRLVEVTLDPEMTAAENADRWYAEARKRERAAAQIPQLVDAARQEAQRWSAALDAAERGTVLDWVAEAVARGREDGEGGESEENRPYRRYRTSGGLEVRVGRSARHNDQLTFGHSRPGDVWLHARSVPGSHVILRWQQADASPPARDLAEAAGLAALFSKARSSALVPVDWTRRKYVRKPRGAAPGAVIPQMVRTLFVEPDPALEERLRAE